MSVIDSLRRRGRFLAAGFLSFLVVLAAIRWSGGEPLLQPAGDIGLIIGFVFVAGVFVIADTYRGPSGGAP
jgi:hypothetical protein